LGVLMVGEVMILRRSFGMGVCRWHGVRGDRGAARRSF
jgi:hypothetical protein